MNYHPIPIRLAKINNQSMDSIQEWVGLLGNGKSYIVLAWLQIGTTTLNNKF